MIRQLLLCTFISGFPGTLETNISCNINYYYVIPALVVIMLFDVRDTAHKDHIFNDNRMGLMHRKRPGINYLKAQSAGVVDHNVHAKNIIPINTIQVQSGITRADTDRNIILQYSSPFIPMKDAILKRDEKSHIPKTPLYKQSFSVDQHIDQSIVTKHAELLKRYIKVHKIHDLQKDNIWYFDKFIIIFDINDASFHVCLEDAKLLSGAYLSGHQVFGQILEHINNKCSKQLEISKNHYYLATQTNKCNAYSIHLNDRYSCSIKITPCSDSTVNSYIDPCKSRVQYRKFVYNLKSKAQVICTGYQSEDNTIQDYCCNMVSNFSSHIASSVRYNIQWFGNKIFTIKNLKFQPIHLFIKDDGLKDFESFKAMMHDAENKLCIDGGMRLNELAVGMNNIRYFILTAYKEVDYDY